MVATNGGGQGLPESTPEVQWSLSQNASKRPYTTNPLRSPHLLRRLALSFCPERWTFWMSLWAFFRCSLFHRRPWCFTSKWLKKSHNYGETACSTAPNGARTQRNTLESGVKWLQKLQFGAKTPWPAVEKTAPSADIRLTLCRGVSLRPPGQCKVELKWCAVCGESEPHQAGWGKMTHLRCRYP